MRALEDCYLYGILDLGYAPRPALRKTALAMLDHGVDIIQLRAKNFSAEEIAEMALEMRTLTRKAEVPLIINDYPKVARETGADGVHVGQDDVDVGTARSLAGESCLVGKSTHSLEQARAAVSEGADYIGFGPLFATPTKPEYTPVGIDGIAAVEAAVTVPVFCIGGVKRENLRDVVQRGARRVVIVSGILQAIDTAAYVRECKTILEGNT